MCEDNAKSCWESSSSTSNVALNLLFSNVSTNNGNRYFSVFLAK